MEQTVLELMLGHDVASEVGAGTEVEQWCLCQRGTHGLFQHFLLKCLHEDQATILMGMRPHTLTD